MTNRHFENQKPQISIIMVIVIQGEGEVAVFDSAKRWDRRSSEVLMEFATPCHYDAEVVGP